MEGCKPYSTCVESDWGLFAEVRYFQLGGLDIPDELNQRFLKALVLQEENETEKLKQESQVIRKETQAQVSQSFVSSVSLDIASWVQAASAWVVKNRRECVNRSTKEITPLPKR